MPTTSTPTPASSPEEHCSPWAAGAHTTAYWVVVAAFFAVIAWLIYACVKRTVFFLGKDEQLVVTELTDTVVHNGPGIKLVSPLVKEKYKRKAELLEKLAFIKVRESLSGGQRVEVGPSLTFLGAYDEVVERGRAVSLKPIEYVVVSDQESGEQRLEIGPQVWTPGAYEVASSKRTALSLESNQYVKLLDRATGQRWIERGETLLFPKPSWEVQGGVQTAIRLKKTEYVRLLDEASGAIRVERGEQMLVPTPTEVVLPGDDGVLTAINLKVYEYVKILDTASGTLRVVQGEATVMLGATEALVGGGKQAAVEIDRETAVRLRNKRTGALQLVTEQGLFIPRAEDQIDEVQKLIKLADYECVIVENDRGELSFYYGDDEKRGDQPRAFFIPPHHRMHTLTWSRGRRRESRDLRIDRIDRRPQYMSFEFNTRTSDNVELVLEGTFFWQVENVETMVRKTGDTTGDVCNHARSKFIALVSKVTLKHFMDNFQELAARAHREDDEFYASRGLKIHSLEVTAYRCQDKSTARILEQIIQETTNRMNRLSQQESENEVKMFAMAGEIEQETRRAELLKVQQGHKLLEATNEGEAEAQRVQTFLAATEAAVPSLEKRIELWNVLRKKDALGALPASSRLYFTPSDVNLSIETVDGALPSVAE